MGLRKLCSNIWILFYSWILLLCTPIFLPNYAWNFERSIQNTIKQLMSINCSISNVSWSVVSCWSPKEDLLLSASPQKVSSEPSAWSSDNQSRKAYQQTQWMAHPCIARPFRQERHSSGRFLLTESYVSCKTWRCWSLSPSFWLTEISVVPWVDQVTVEPE